MISVPADLDAAFAAELDTASDLDLDVRRRNLANVVSSCPYESLAWREGTMRLDTLDYVRMRRAAHGHHLHH